MLFEAGHNIVTKNMFHDLAAEVEIRRIGSSTFLKYRCHIGCKPAVSGFSGSKRLAE